MDGATMAEEAPQKKKKLTSWQRRKKKEAVQTGEPAASQKQDDKARAQLLEQRCAAAKTASKDARERFRLGQPAENGDKELADAYRACKSELNEFIKQREATKFAELCDAMQSTGKKRKVVEEEAKKVSEQAADEGDAAQSKKKSRSARRRERRVEFNSSQGS